MYKTKNPNLLQAWGLQENFGHVRVAFKKCGKPHCKKCPHGPYAYYRPYHYPNEPELYLGKCKLSGEPLK